ncbi:MAG TPA: Spy/CpxP family protein refolding chaperone [Bryobacteraceae bacterium]|nr:Spy/CpxP family protein refolding chaperone [Bryobacteraceae bacterium]
MNRRFVSLIGAAALASGVLLAQESAAPDPARHSAGPAAAQQHLQKLSEKLNLTPDQQTQAKAIFRDAMEQSRPIRQQMAQDRKALLKAVQSGASQSEIDQLAAKVGPLASQLAVIRTESFAKFYSILTPEQRSQMNQRAGRHMNHAQAPSGD